MAWQAPHFIYPQQGKENPVESAMRGLSQGLVLANQIRGVRDANKQDALNADIKAAYEESAAKIAELEKNNVPQEAKGKNMSPIPQQQIDLTALTGVSGIADPRIGQSPIPQSGPSLKDKVIASTQSASQDEARNKRIELNAQMSNKIIGLYYKHGFQEDAAKMERSFMEQTAAMARISPQMAENVWNNSLLSDRYGRVKFKDADAKWKELKDGSGFYNEADPSQVVKHPRTIDDFIGKEYNLKEGEEVRTIIRTKDGIKEVTLAANPKKKEDKPPVTRTIKQGRYEVTQEYAGEGKWRQIGIAPRYKNEEGVSGGGSGGRGAESRAERREALTANKEYYKGLEKSLKELIEDPTAGEKSREVYQRALQNLPIYMRKDADQIRAGRQPLNQQQLDQWMLTPPGKTQQPKQTTTRKPGRREYFAAMKKANPNATDAEINEYLDKKGVR